MSHRHRRKFPVYRWPKPVSLEELPNATLLGMREVTIDCPYGALVISFGLAVRADGGPHIELSPLWMFKASDEQYAWGKAHQPMLVAAVMDLVMEEWTRRIEARIRAGRP